MTLRHKGVTLITTYNAIQGCFDCLIASAIYPNKDRITQTIAVMKPH